LYTDIPIVWLSISDRPKTLTGQTAPLIAVRDGIHIMRFPIKNMAVYHNCLDRLAAGTPSAPIHLANFKGAVKYQVIAARIKEKQFNELRLQTAKQKNRSKKTFKGTSCIHSAVWDAVNAANNAKIEIKRKNNKRITANKVKAAKKKAAKEAQEAANALNIATKGVQQAAQRLSPQRNNRKGRQQKKQFDQPQVDLSVFEEEGTSSLPTVVKQAAKESVNNETAIGGKFDSRPSRTRKIPIKLR
jgi:hypothetical protein